VQVLQRHSIARGGHQVDQVLVRWSDCDEALDTWEDEITLRRQFPAATAWGLAASKGGGMSATREMVHVREQKDVRMAVKIRNS
jgi:hypothetical protein